jgi:hypothetical protein
MREEELRDLFVDAGRGQPPPSRLSAEDIIASGRRIRRRRKQIAVLGSGLATAGVATVAILFLPGGGASPHPVPPAHSIPGSPTLPSDSTPPVRPTPPTPSRIPTTPSSPVLPSAQPPTALPTSPGTRVPTALPTAPRTVPPPAPRTPSRGPAQPPTPAVSGP